MSTRSTIYLRETDDESTHVYHECFDEQQPPPVYIERWMRGGKRTVTENIVMTPEETIAVYLAVEKSLAWIARSAAETDAEIEAKVRDAVEKRTAPDAKSWDKIAGCLTYGSSDNPPEQQIQRGLEYFFQHREKCRDAMKLVEQTRKS